MIKKLLLVLVTMCVTPGSLGFQLLSDNGENVEDLWSNLTTLVANTVAAMHGPLAEAWEALGSSGKNLFQVLLGA